MAATIGKLLSQATEHLLNHTDAPELDAQRLLLKTLNQSEPSWLISHSNDPVSDAQYQHYLALIKRRKVGEPLAYILGFQEFFGREFIVTSDVLIPRPETENLITKTLEHLSKHPEITTLADIGTGSGCIAITLALELPPTDQLHIIATDISHEGLAVATQNIALHGASDRITLVQEDMRNPKVVLTADFIVSNPPYVPTTELDRPPTITTQGLAFEPRQALDGGSDGDSYIVTLKKYGLPGMIESTGGVITHL